MVWVWVGCGVGVGVVGVDLQSGEPLRPAEGARPGGGGVQIGRDRKG